jgi:hypothetical protein
MRRMLEVEKALRFLRDDGYLSSIGSPESERDTQHVLDRDGKAS